MPISPSPESDRPLVSIPFNLYFHGLDKPHWSSEIDGFNPDPDARRRAEKSRQLVGSARRRRVATLHDSIKRLEKAVYGLSELDETGFTDVAAQHLDRRLANTVSQCRTLLADIAGAVDAYRADEVAAATPPAPEPDAADAGQDEGYEYHCEAHGVHAYNDPEAGWAHDEEHERDSENFDAAADARAADQVITALATRTKPSGGIAPQRTPRPDQIEFVIHGGNAPIISAPAARTAPHEAESFPTPADIAKGAVTPIRKHDVWPPR